MDPRSVIARVGEIHIVDVREPFEWDAGHIEQAQHIPMREIPRSLDQMPDGRSIVAVCRSGNRSKQVARFLIAKGFDVHNLAGGMKAWERVGLPVIGPGGKPGKVV